VLLGKLAALVIPFGTVAFRINLLSALLGAGALVLLARTAAFFVEEDTALLLALLLAVSPAFWRLSQVTEMYSLNAFLAALAVYVLARALLHSERTQTTSLPVLYGLGFLFGIAAGGHQTIIFLLPGLLWFLQRQFKYSFRQFGVAALFFLLGLSVYLFLPVRSLTGPLSNWGKPDTLQGLFRAMTRADYGGMKLHPEESTFSWTPQLVLQHLILYVRSLAAQFTWPMALAGLWGLLAAWRTRFGKFIAVSFIIAGPFFVIFSNLPPAEKTTLPILEPHLVLPNLLFVLCIALALKKLPAQRVVQAAVLAVFVFSLGTHAASCNYRGHFYAYDYGRNVLATIEKNGVIYDPDDATAFITAYLQVAEKRRPDVTVAAYFRTLWGYRLLRERHPELLPAQEIVSGQELSRALLDHNRVLHPVYAELPQKFPQGYATYPVGLLYRLSSNGERQPTTAPFAFYRMRNRYNPGVSDDFFTGQVISYYAAAHNNQGLALAEKKDYAAAKAQYFSALGIDPSLSASYNNLGTLAFFTGNYGEAEQWFGDVLQQKRHDPSALFNLALAFKAQKRTSEAERLFRQAWENSAYPDAGNELGLAYLNSGRPQEAVALYRTLLERAPRYLPGYYNMGLALRATGDRAESRRYFETYLNNTADPREQAEVRALLREVQ
jgi:tetratricopeptide (TPR) repeat protein